MRCPSLNAYGTISPQHNFLSFGIQVRESTHSGPCEAEESTVVWCVALAPRHDSCTWEQCPPGMPVRKRVCLDHVFHGSTAESSLVCWINRPAHACYVLLISQVTLDQSLGLPQCHSSHWFSP